MTDTVDASRRPVLVLRLLVVEGLVNLSVLAMKLTVGLTTGSVAVLADALHSLTDVANNVIAWIVMRTASRPADRRHPYGHQKFEMLAVFVLAVLLAAVGLEIAGRAISKTTTPPAESGWGLTVMLVVLAINIALTVWQRHWATKLDSKILMADASHTFADVLTTVVVILGWQLSARGYPWLDSVCALGVAAMIFYLAFRLFRDAIPVLVDEIAIEPEVLTASICQVPGVIDVRRVRSRWVGTERAADVIVTVEASMTTRQSHDIANAVESMLAEDFGVRDTTVHVEPHTD